LPPLSPCRKGDDSLTTVYDRVKTIVVDKLGVEEGEVTGTASFIENLNADSLDLVELIMAFEEEFFYREPECRLPRLGGIDNGV